ncbi:indole-3-acetic acid-induced protein ARG2-like [Vicia villosa]|uniref:indole-3-acetic acid-induced protein ARG2-like n=1 Tax=Vicia villosa TaxID=3911 RepID=UPI00273A8657|nr:indole-3-acetic acid-induced protein ARG2-like [Vicia villosa]
MARCLANVKVVSTIILDGFSNTLTRRGYSAATESATRGVVGSIGNKMGGTKLGEEKVASTYKVSWVPDPVTGYYKPENIKDVDVADLRAKLLQKNLKN